jgi:hypothetical protein
MKSETLEEGRLGGNPALGRFWVTAQPTRLKAPGDLNFDAARICDRPLGMPNASPLHEPVGVGLQRSEIWR